MTNEKRLSVSEEWEKLNITSDFVFGRLMSNKACCLEVLRRILPDLNIQKIEFVTAQKELANVFNKKSIRMDVWIIFQ